MFQNYAISILDLNSSACSISLTTLESRKVLIVPVIVRRDNKLNNEFNCNQFVKTPLTKL